MSGDNFGQLVEDVAEYQRESLEKAMAMVDEKSWWELHRYMESRPWLMMLLIEQVGADAYVKGARAEYETTKEANER